MSAVPSQARLQAVVGRTFNIETADVPVPVVLQAVHPGVSMNELYTCYSAQFVLPEGMGGPQGTYRIRHPDGQAWDLFMTPVMPAADGRHRLQAVFHYEIARSTEVA